MPPRKSRESLERDRRVLLETLIACRTGRMDHLDAFERENVVERLKQRIAELEAKIAACGKA